MITAPLPRIQALSAAQCAVLRAVRDGQPLVRTFGHGDRFPTYTLSGQPVGLKSELVTDLWHDCYLVTHGEVGAGPLQLHLTDKGRAALG